MMFFFTHWLQRILRKHRVLFSITYELKPFGIEIDFENKIIWIMDKQFNDKDDQ